EWVHVQLHQQKGMISLSPPTICNSALKDISRMVGLDRYHIHRIFKSTFHLAPHQYLIQLRLTRARDLLARSISPAQVASDLCFSDQSHLSRWFKRCYELTPAAYRKICTNLQD
ncbi:helix-turn-helix domain-containing protein, partial [Acinetobacter baumannii]|uniref:helix-turn-helix domain-containing protein n=1 Tax=Acinetobacter baumannii TaxID=470 RepID=UPI001CDCC545